MNLSQDLLPKSLEIIISSTHYEHLIHMRSFMILSHHPNSQHVQIKSQRYNKKVIIKARNKYVVVKKIGLYLSRNSR